MFLKDKRMVFNYNIIHFNCYISWTSNTQLQIPLASTFPVHLHTPSYHFLPFIDDFKNWYSVGQQILLHGTHSIWEARSAVPDAGFIHPTLDADIWLLSSHSGHGSSGGESWFLEHQHRQIQWQLPVCLRDKASLHGNCYKVNGHFMESAEMQII